MERVVCWLRTQPITDRFPESTTAVLFVQQPEKLFSEGSALLLMVSHHHHLTGSWQRIPRSPLSLRQAECCRFRPQGSLSTDCTASTSQVRLCCHCCPGGINML